MNKQIKPWFIISLIVLVVGMTVLQLQPNIVYAGGGRWVTDTTSTVWTYQKICRDGAILQSAWTENTSIGGPFDRIIQASLLPEAIPEPLSGSYNIYRGYLRPISVPVTLSTELRDQPVTDDTGAPEFFTNDVGKIYWDRDLTIGSLVIFHTVDNLSISIGVNGTIGLVEDCLIEAEGDSEIRSFVDRFDHPYHARFGNQLLYKVARLPTDRTLTINGSAASIGDTFTYQDVLDRNITISDGALEDSFSYQVNKTIRVSVESNGEQATGVQPNPPLILGNRSWQPAISADGSSIAFSSSSPSLTDDSVADSNNAIDVFVRHVDGEHSTTRLISNRFDQAGTANGASYQPDISPSGYFVSFSSAASNLNQNQSFGLPFRIVRAGIFGEVNAFDPYSYFQYQAEDNSIIYETDFALNSHSSSVLDDGTVAFHTFEPFPDGLSTDSNNDGDVLVNEVWDRTLAGSENLDLDTTGNRGSFLAELSDDGEFVVFETDATNLDARTEFDDNGFTDIVVRSVKGLGIPPYIISVNSAGELAVGGDSNRPQISWDGDHIVFDSTATNLILNGPTDGTRHVYVHDRNVIIGQTDTEFPEPIHRAEGCTTLLSRNFLGASGNGDSSHASISANGRFVAFESRASSFVIGDDNNASDIFVVDRDFDGDFSFFADPENCEPGPSRIFRVSVSSDGTQANGDSIEASISGNGDFVAFTSVATNLVEGDTNGLQDVFLHLISYEVGTISVGPVESATPEPSETPTASPTPDPSSGLPYKSYLPFLAR